MPDEVEFLPIQQCPSSKAFVLKFKKSPERFYIWIQEPKFEEYDDKFVRRMNQALLNKSWSGAPSAAGPSSARNAVGRVLAGVAKREKAPDASLAKIITVEGLSAILANAEARNELFPFIPPGSPKTREELESIIRSPQFQQTLAFMDEALRSGDLAPLLLEMGLDPSLAGPAGGVRAFLNALQEKEGKPEGDSMKK